MAQVIVFNHPDYNFTCCVRHFNPDLTPAEAMALNMPVGATNIFAVDDSILPVDNTFRNAWKVTGGGAVEVDMTVAKDIWLLGIGYALEEKLKELLLNDTFNTVKSERTALLPQIAAAANVAALKLLWPAALPVTDYSVIGIGYKAGD